MMVEQPFLLASGPWLEVKDGNLTAAAIYDRHYSRLPKSRGNPRFAGPGQKMVLLTPCARALFVWRKFKDLCIDPRTGQQQAGINCAAFRNEGAGLASDLIRAAMEAAWARWPAERFYTYVNQRRVASANPGYCFKRAGWTPCGYTASKKLLILEVLP